jgi:hypothetical protein
VLLKDQVDIQEKHFAVVDRTQDEQLAPTLQAAVRTRNNQEVSDPATGKQIKPIFTIDQRSPPASMRATPLSSSDLNCPNAFAGVRFLAF